jgi:hypothetical protein
VSHLPTCPAGVSHLPLQSTVNEVFITKAKQILAIYFKEVFHMKSSKREAKERNNDLTKTQEVTYKEELKSAESVAETKEMTNEDYS